MPEKWVKNYDPECYDCKVAAWNALWDRILDFEAKNDTVDIRRLPRSEAGRVVREFWFECQDFEYSFEPLHKRIKYEDVSESDRFELLYRLQIRYMFLSHEAQLDPGLQAIADRLLAIVQPAIPETGPGTAIGNIPLINLLPKPGYAIEAALRLFNTHEYPHNRLFLRTVRTLQGNAVMGHLTSEWEKWCARATTSTHPPERLVEECFKGTPLRDLFMTPITLYIPHELRFAHTHVVGGPNSGKTSLLLDMVVRDIRSPEQPSVVVVEPHADLIKEILESDLGIEDRLIYLNPRDMEYPPALNIFAQKRKRIRTYDAETRERLRNGVLKTLDYTFAELFPAEITAKQSVPLRYMARLLLSLPETGLIEDGRVVYRNGTLNDMLRLMRNSAPYRPTIEAMSARARDFFENDFDGPEYKATKEQIRYRLQFLMENDTIANLFTASHTKIDLFKELSRGKVILVDTAQDFLMNDSRVFGRLVISLILRAILERGSPGTRLHDTFLYIDEAASYFDDNIASLLTEVRKFRCGVVLAHQFLGQASEHVQSALAASTSIKYASGVSARDARALASDMHTEPEFLLAQQKLNFAVYARGATPTAVSVSVPVRGRHPKLSPSAYEVQIMKTRERVSLAFPVTDSQPAKAAEPDGPPWEDLPTQTATKPVEQVTPKTKGSPQADNEEISDKW